MPKEFEVSSEDNMRIRITGKDSGFIESQSVEANLLYAILQKLDAIKCGLIDIENEIVIK